jgi:hypothetical protein
MTGAPVAVAAVIVAVALLGAAAIVLRAARIHSAAVDRQRERRPFPGQFPGQGPEYQQPRPEPRRRPRRRRRGGRLLLIAVIGVALYCYAGPAATARASRLVHGHAGLGPTAVAVIAVVALAALVGWTLSRRFARSQRYTRRPGW